MNSASGVAGTMKPTTEPATVAGGGANTKGVFRMPDKKKCRLMRYQLMRRQGGSDANLNPEKVYHAAPAFVKRRIQDE